MKTWICATMVSFFGPTQGPARLYAYVKDKGFDVSLKDLNQDIYFKLLSKSYLERTFKKIKAVFPFTALNRSLRNDIGSILRNSSHDNMSRLLSSGIIAKDAKIRLLKRVPMTAGLLTKFVSSKIKDDNMLYALLANEEYVISEIDRSLSILDKHFLGLPADEFIGHFRNLLCGKALIDAAHFPSQIDFGLGFQGYEYRPRTSDIIKSVNDKKHNFLIPYYENEVMTAIEKERPGIVGISLSHTSELVPVFTLANMIKSGYPDIHICLGGAVATEVAYRIRENAPLWDCIDSLILGPGEHAFCELIDALEKKRSLSSVPNIVYKEKGDIKESEVKVEFDLNEACTPEYVNVRPNSGLPLETSSGCYWGKCIFCYYPRTGLSDIFKGEKTRTRDIELVLEDMRKLKEMYNPIYISITDSSLPPKRLEEIISWNIQSKSPVKFSAFIRFEKEFKDPKFCEKLARGGFLGGQAGLESGSQRVNDIINKGVDVEDVRLILNNFYKTGILIHIYSLVGIPGEKKEDAYKTYKFINDHHDLITLDWQLYPMDVLEHGPIAQRAKEFGITFTPLPKDYLAQPVIFSTAEGLSRNESIALSIKFQTKLERHLNPLNKILDIESYKIYLLTLKAQERSLKIRV